MAALLSSVSAITPREAIALSAILRSSPSLSEASSHAEIGARARPWSCPFALACGGPDILPFNGLTCDENHNIIGIVMYALRIDFISTFRHSLQSNLFFVCFYRYFGVSDSLSSEKWQSAPFLRLPSLVGLNHLRSAYVLTHPIIVSF